jgi:hypothetical protein
MNGSIEAGRRLPDASDDREATEGPNGQDGNWDPAAALRGWPTHAVNLRESTFFEC